MAKKKRVGGGEEEKKGTTERERTVKAPHRIKYGSTHIIRET